MLIDMHCHSKYSQDNQLEPEALIERAVELGLNGVCFTEHYSVDCSKEVEKLKVPDNFLVLRGVEISTDYGHLLAYGLIDDSWNRWGRNSHLELHKVMDSVASRGGICVPAHPFRGWESIGNKILDFDGFHAVETFNGGNGLEQNREAIKIALKMGLPCIGGSDCHYVDHVGRAFTEFTCKIRDMSEVVNAVKQGKCRARSLIAY